MISPRGPHVPWMLRYVDRALALLVLFDIVVVVAYVYLEQRWLSLPNLPLAIGGGGLCSTNVRFLRVVRRFSSPLSHAALSSFSVLA